MKRMLFLLIATALSTGVWGQKVVKEIEKKFENGKPEVIAYYRDAVSTYNLTKREVMGADGKKVREENYLNGSLHGKVMAWKPFDGTLQMELNYLKGKLEGVQKYFFSDGSVERELNYVGGKLDGRQIERWFKESGDSLKSEHHYSLGMLHGQQRQWYKGMKPKYDINFVAGKPDGIQRFWDEAGQMREERWRTGVYDEVLENWTAAQPKRVRVMDFKREGDSLHIVLGKVLQKEMRYFETGSIAAITLMTDQPETQEFHLGGKLKAKGLGTLESRQGKWEFWHPNGQKMSAGVYLDGKKVALHESWDDKGNLREEEIWSADGNRRESWKVAFYHPNGKKAMEGALDEAGKKTGMWKSWYSNGSKFREESWGSNCQNGAGRPVLTDFSEWDESGKLVRKGDEFMATVWNYFPNGDPMELTELYFLHRNACTPEPFDKYENGNMKASSVPADYSLSIITRKVTYYEGGDTLRIDRFNREGKRHGFQEGWFNDAKQQYSIQYLDGRVQGKVKEWYPSGQIMLDYQVQSAVGGPVNLVEGTAYSDKGKDYVFTASEGKEPKKQMVEIESLSYYKRFILENR